jgi:hypothetical protein
MVTRLFLLDLLLDLIKYVKINKPNELKPQPLDTHEIELLETMQPLIESLARNTHNVWAKEKIKRGWTFGLSEFVDASQKRSPHLVPYDSVCFKFCFFIVCKYKNVLRLMNASRKRIEKQLPKTFELSNCSAFSWRLRSWNMMRVSFNFF